VTERRTELVIALVPVLLTAVALLSLLNPEFPFAIVNGPLDVAINTLATIVGVAVAGLGWVHFRESHEAAPLLRAAAFLTLAAVNGLKVALMSSGLSLAFGLSLSSPGQLPIWAAAVARSVASVLLFLAGLAAFRGWRADKWPAALALWGPALAVIALISIGGAIQPSLPALLGPAELNALREDPTAPSVVFGARALVAIQFAIGLAYLGAAALSYWSYRRNRLSLDAFLAAGLTVAAFSQVQFAIHPGVFEGLITLGDLERIVFDAILFVALAAESREEVRALRAAYGQISVLREADFARATAEERARLAREIHDGMSQELWYAKLKQARLAAMDLPGEAKALAAEVAAALESALSEARQAIFALRPTQAGSFSEVLPRFVADFSDRFGIPAECDCDPDADVLPARAQAELLRIVQEALTNARRHADPTVVRVTLKVTDAGARLTVSDNGRGFDPAAARDTGYGLRSMRERAELIGGHIVVDSGKQDGTRITVELALKAAP
jgi:signal transduction histidine kinase